MSLLDSLKNMMGGKHDTATKGDTMVTPDPSTNPMQDDPMPAGDAGAPTGAPMGSTSPMNPASSGGMPAGDAAPATPAPSDGSTNGMPAVDPMAGDNMSAPTSTDDSMSSEAPADAAAAPSSSSGTMPSGLSDTGSSAPADGTTPPAGDSDDSSKPAA